MIISPGLKAEMLEPPSDVSRGTSRVSIPRELYDRGCVRTVEEATAAALRIGLPVMIKASEGGGGKGIRKVENEASLPALFRQASGSQSAARDTGSSL